MNRKMMKTQYKSMFRAYLMSGMLLSLLSCKVEGDDLALNALPQADFEATEVAPGKIKLVNKTSGPSIAHWTIVNSGQKFQGNEVEVGLIFAGSYNVKLDVVAQGGMTSVTKPVNVTRNDPDACSDTRALGFIAGCSQKKWKLNPEPGAFKVGPGADDGSWWASDAGAVKDRACEFNDEFTFHFNSEGTFVYDNKGDFFADGYLGKNSSGCEPEGNLTGSQALWKSGSFRFSVSEGTGARKLGQLQLIGKGAHIGVKKAHNGGETPSGPVGDAIVYDILEMTKNAGGKGYDLLKVGVNIGGDAWWTFTLRSF